MHCGALLLFFIYISFPSSTDSTKAGGILPFLKETVEYVKDIWNTISPMLEEIRDLPLNMGDNVENIFQSKFSDLSFRVEHMDRVVQSMASATNFNLKKDLPSQVRLELRIDTLLELISIINSADDTYKEILGFGYLNTTQPQYERHTIENFATYVVSHAPSSVQGAMDRLHGMIYPDPSDSNFFLHQNVLELIAKVLKAGDGSMCQTKQSPNQIIYSLFNSLQMTQLKGFTMMQFSWMLLRVYNKGNFTIESRRMRERYLSRIVEQGQSLSEALKLADTSYWRCDPEQHEEGKTYLQLTRLLQGFVINEVDLSPSGRCFKDCPYYDTAKQQGCYMNNFCASQRSCAGDVRDCQYIYKSMTICQPDPLKSKRRYEWIRYWDGQKKGNTELPCHKTSSAESWRRWIFWKCSYCFCLCDDTYNSDRYFSLRQALASTEQNKVITGIRFVQMNGIVHMQIQEGELELHGRINQSLTTWQPVNNFTITGTTEGLDYMKMSYYKRAMDLDDLTAPPGHVITGVRFRVIGSHLNLEIRANPFNFTTGKLSESGTKSLWLGNHNSENARARLSMGSPDSPLNTIFPSNIDSKSNQYLLFTHSDIAADAAQTTVPFLDAQDVAPQPPVPLAGIGVYHKGHGGFGGFVGLKVFTLNVGSYVKHEIAALFDTRIELMNKT